ncbi:centrosomal protein of 89 kDa [Diretmus argenteus]
MFTFSFRRKKENDFRHIAHGLTPAASIAPKAAVPRTPPPRSPNPSPERPRSALAAAIFSSSLTGRTWAFSSTRPRSFSESDRLQSFVSEPNTSTAFYTRSEDLASRPRLASPDHSEEELEDEEKEEEEEEEEEDHVYQTLDREMNCPITEPVYTRPLKPKAVWIGTTTSSTLTLNTSAPQGCVLSPLLYSLFMHDCMATHSSNTIIKFADYTTVIGLITDFTEETSVRSKASRDSSKKKASFRKSSGSQREGTPPKSPTPHTPNHPTHPSLQASEAYREVQKEVQKEVVRALREQNVALADERRLLEERLQRLEQELSHSQVSSSRRHSAGVQAELQTLRQQAQELVDENDGLKLTVHRLNVELSRYQARFRPLSKQECSKINGLPMTGSPPPWLLDMKYLSPLLLAYEDRLNEKDALLQAAEEEVKNLHTRVEEVIKENERLHDEIAKTGGVSQKDWHQLQQQATLVLQENQVLIDQLEVQCVKAKASHSRHHSEVSKVSKQLMLMEAEKQRLQEELEESQREVQKSRREVQGLQARLQDAVTFAEHCNIVARLRRQLEQEEEKHRSLQEENRSMYMEKTNLTTDIKSMEVELELSRQANRKTEMRLGVLKRQKEDCVLKEVMTRHYLAAVISVAEQTSQERDQLLHMASGLQQDKRRFISRVLEGTVRFEKLQEAVKVYRRQASARLAALEEAAEGKTTSYRREILHLQRQLGERQEAEEKLLQYKRDIEEELEVVWQAATRENQQAREALLDSNPSGELRGRAILWGASPSWPYQAPDEEVTTSP